MQNFRAKEDTAMRSTPDLGEEEYLATIAVTRLLLGPSVTVQAPPNLSDPQQISRLLAAGVDDWGGVSPVTPDHVNPERPWPEVEDLRRWTAESGLALTERLTAHPRYVLGALERDEAWIDPRLHPHVRALVDPATGLAREDARRDRPGGRSPTAAWRRPGRAPGAWTCTGAWTRRAAAPTGAATSTRSTATGRRSPHGSTDRACRGWTPTSVRRWVAPRTTRRG